MKAKFKRVFLSLVTVALAAVCSGAIAQSLKTPDQAANSNGVSIVATVNGQNITTAELNQAAGGPANGIEDPQARALVLSQVLDDLINMTLLEQEFKKNNLNKEEKNKWQIEFANRQSAATFYLNSQLNKLPRLDQKMVDDFILAHPEFTAKRKTYHFNQIMVDASLNTTQAELQGLLDKGTNLEGINAWLKQRKIPNSRGNLWRGSEQIPSGILKSLDGLSKNAMTLQMTADNKRIIILRLIDSYPDPVDVEDAKAGFIRGYQEDARAQAAQTIIKDLRAAAAIKVISTDLAMPVNKIEVGMTKEMPKGPIFSQLLVIWYFAVLVLGAVAMVVTYQGLNAKRLKQEKLIKKLDFSHPSTINLNYVMTPAFILLAGWFVFPLYQILESPPFWLSLQVLVKLFVIGLFFGAMVIAACYFVPWLRRSLRQSSRGLVLLTGVHTLVMLAMLLR
jgi:EpsD family peptidyl-prolyl cis-trans isomerase